MGVDYTSRSERMIYDTREKSNGGVLEAHFFWVRFSCQNEVSGHCSKNRRSDSVNSRQSITILLLHKLVSVSEQDPSQLTQTFIAWYHVYGAGPRRKTDSFFITNHGAMGLVSQSTCIVVVVDIHSSFGVVKMVHSIW
ncbi:hypothetical protein BDV33DRAFT_164251 [Aspergillus novoparasiticus]|uniref:Uncharacterized protein n=1 Tax=Aspergillus novoparasiticus TaxID=986946 RepID=A0A5N6F688_9EURO|nr:hypothetical protein BDV33DRAFT_164251 [Aspergillus novoparasiticus]